jgi:hypothetical protein
MSLSVLCLVCRWLLTHKTSGSYTDQAGFEHLYNTLLTERERKKIVILRPDALNSEAPAMGRQAVHNQVLHLASEGVAMRRDSFAVGAKEVCAALMEERTPAHQLKMTKRVLRDIAEKRYDVCDESADLICAVLCCVVFCCVCVVTVNDCV